MTMSGIHLIHGTFGKRIIDNMKTQTVIVLGSMGMLGRYMIKYLSSIGYHVVGVSRAQLQVDEYTTCNCIKRVIQEYDSVAAIINCIGVIKPQIDKYGTKLAIAVNSLFPHILSDACNNLNIPCYHITTDCVFSGKAGNYNEKSIHDPEDVYGKSKSLGEPDNCSVVRTSIIGEEYNQHRSLIEWAKSQKGKAVNGFNNHLWNGVTCLQLAKVLHLFIQNNVTWCGVKHIFSNTLTKFQLLHAISEAFQLNLLITNTQASVSCDRTLSTIYDELKIPSIDTQLRELANFSATLYEERDAG
jgi:dTDP-4-dehydrorhamnose reductase